MSLFELFRRLSEQPVNPELENARNKHEALPQTDFFKNSRLSAWEIAVDTLKTKAFGAKLGRSLNATIQEHYPLDEQEPVRESLLNALSYLATNARIFPDMDDSNILYTDYFDLIELAKDMGLGDESLPHWPEEPNVHKRYLELTIAEFLQMLLGFSEEALLEEFQFGASQDAWIRYVLRETLKTRKRLERARRKQEESLSVVTCKQWDSESGFRDNQRS